MQRARAYSGSTQPSTRPDQLAAPAGSPGRTAGRWPRGKSPSKLSRTVCGLVWSTQSIRRSPAGPQRIPESRRTQVSAGRCDHRRPRDVQHHQQVGLNILVVALPFVNSALADRAPFKDSVNALRSEGVRILLGPGEFEPHPPGSGRDRISGFPWQLAIASVSDQLPAPEL